MPEETATSPPAEDDRGRTDSWSQLCALVARLRSPDGCPWDREQTVADLRPYVLEEAHELAAAIDGGNWEEIEEELGDLLFQAAFLTELGREAGKLAVDSALHHSHAKMVDRHPHVFGDESLADSQRVRQAWERRKARQNRNRPLLEGVPTSLPALTRAFRVTQKAAGVGFDWTTSDAVLHKVEEELDELKRAMAAGDSTQQREELGDLFFALVSLARHLSLDAEGTLAQAVDKFCERFGRLEEEVRSSSRTLGDASAEELEAAWEKVKQADRNQSSETA